VRTRADERSSASR